MAMKVFFKSSLHGRLVLMMLFLSMSLISILIFLYYQTEKALYNEFERQTLELSRAIQIGLKEATSSTLSDPKRLEAYLKDLNPKGVKEISLISTSDRIIASTNPDNIGKWVTTRKKELIVRADIGQPVTGEGQVYNVVIPIISGDKHMGYIYLTMNTEDFSVFLQTSIIRRVVAAILIFGIGILFSLILAKRYTKPIEEVVIAARNVAGGNLNQELYTNRKDEIGELARSFNYMVRKLREERELSEKLRKAEHFSGIGQVAQSIAHEIKNPLNFLSLSIDHIKEYLNKCNSTDTDRYISLIVSMKNEIHRLSKFAESFLEYGKPIGLNIRMVNIGGLIEEVIDLVGITATKRSILIRKEYSSLPYLAVDPEFIKTCIYNVIINAFEAMPDGGTLTIRTNEIDSRFHLCIEDTGVGVDKEKMSKIFEPFFTTKGGGLGLGLSLTKRIIEEHGGKVLFESKKDMGTAVTFILPTG